MRIKLKRAVVFSAVIAAIVACLGAGPAIANEVVEAKIAAVGEQLVGALNHQDAEALGNVFDIHALGRRVGRDFASTERELNGFATGFERSGERLILKLLESAKTSNGQTKVMKIVSRDNELRPLVRLDCGEDGFDYLELVVEPNASGTYRGVDWYQLSTGELVSTTVSTAMQLMMDANPSLLKGILGPKSIDPKVVDNLRAVSALESEGKFAEALSIMEKLPPELADSRIFLIRRVQLASQSNNEALYRRTLSKLAEKYSTDPTAAFLLLDHYVYEKNLAKQLASIDAIESRVGSDGMTESLRAAAYYQVGKYDQMLTHALRSVQVEPDRGDSYFILALAQISESKFDQAVETYKTLSSEFDYEFTEEAFKKDPEMKRFVKSSAFKAWLPNK